MPTYPVAPVVNFLGQVAGSVAPAQVPFVATRVKAFRSAPSLSTGASALLGTLGIRLGTGTVATQAYPTGLSFR
jgi:hypothetical protein